VECEIRMEEEIFILKKLPKLEKVDRKKFVRHVTEEKEANECNKDIVESIKFLEKDSKPCPKCTSLICKIENNATRCIV